LDMKRYERVGDMLTCGVEVSDPQQVHKIFSLKTEKIAVQCSPGVCEFHFGDAVLKIRDEYVDYALQEEAVDECNGCGVWDSDNFRIVRRPGVITFVNKTTAKRLAERQIEFTPPMLVASETLARRLDALTPEEERKLMEWLLPYIYADCQDKLVLIPLLWFPAEQRDELMQLLGRIGKLEAARMGDGVCAEKPGYCDVYEKRGRRHVYQLAYCPSNPLLFQLAEELSLDAFEYGLCVCSFVVRY